MFYDKYPNGEMTEEFIREHYQDHEWDWSDIYMNLSIDFIRQFQDVIPWRYVSEYKVLLDKDFHEFKNKINWGVASSYQKLSPETLNRFEEYLDYTYLGTNTKLPEEFVLKHKDDVNWRVMVTYQTFSKNFWKQAIQYIKSPWTRDTIRQKYNIK